MTYTQVRYPSLRTKIDIQNGIIYIETWHTQAGYPSPRIQEMLIAGSKFNCINQISKDISGKLDVKKEQYKRAITYVCPLFACYMYLYCTYLQLVMYAAALYSSCESIIVQNIKYSWERGHNPPPSLAFPSKLSFSQTNLKSFCQIKQNYFCARYKVVLIY